MSIVKLICIVKCDSDDTIQKVCKYALPSSHILAEERVLGTLFNLDIYYYEKICSKLLEFKFSKFAISEITKFKFQ